MSCFDFMKLTRLAVSGKNQNKNITVVSRFLGTFIFFQCSILLTRSSKT